MGVRSWGVLYQATRRFFEVDGVEKRYSEAFYFFDLKEFK
jgi:hypothetical protein